MFDTLLYAKKLEAAGITRDQAEVHIQVMTEMIINGVATKQDVASIKGELPLIESRLRTHFQDKIHGLTIQMGMMIAGSSALIVSILMYFK